VVATPLPDELEIQQAIAACQPDLNQMVFPAYLLDCGHRLLTWNTFIPKLFSGTLTPSSDHHLSMLRVLFDPTYPLQAKIANPSVFFPAQIRALRYEMHQFRSEIWYQPLLDELLADCPLFERCWTEALANHNDYLIAARPLVPVELDVAHPDVSHTGSAELPVMRFRLTAEPFAQDRRFRVIYYIPADSATMQQCVTWLNANQSLD
ncbi:MAG TPA: hypothetical protein VHL11_03845, partial [Phototrophicaceae bacterium]|nr:hypothetical protein [Phototrophicaceae bacterium]